MSEQERRMVARYWLPTGWLLHSFTYSLNNSSPAPLHFFTRPLFHSERTPHGLLAAGRLFQLRLAGRNLGGLDHRRHFTDKHLLQAAGPERHPVHRTPAAYHRYAERSPYISSARAPAARHLPPGHRAGAL